MRQQPESRKSEGGPLDLKDYLRIWRRPQTWLADDREIQRQASDSPCGSPGGISRTPVQINNYPSCIIMKSYFR